MRSVGKAVAAFVVGVAFSVGVFLVVLGVVEVFRTKPLGLPFPGWLLVAAFVVMFTSAGWVIIEAVADRWDARRGKESS